MLKKLTLVLFLVVGALALRASAQSPEIPPRLAVPNDTAEYRRFVLPNGIKVILLSDSKLNKSSASLAVAAGSYCDPASRQGLAHFLEHMLFLGTEKYPDPAEYSNFLSSNGGYNNAYTAGDHTNYHFEIRHEAFEGAIDRMSQFFIAPLFTAEFADREMNAVNSENQKNLENDAWRGYQISNSLYRPGHPANHFSTGSRETLTGTTHDELLAFYHAHYSANLMTLSLVGKASLDQLEQWARTYFSPVKNLNLPENRFPADYLPTKPALRLARMEPIKDLRTLSLEFPLPATQKNWASKPELLAGFILGHEGEGSLLAELKAEGLATQLGASAETGSADFASFNININLTPAGLAQYPHVIERVFSAIARLRAAGYPAYLFHERQAMGRLDEAYQDKGEGADRAVLLANLIREYPLELAERVPYLWVREDPAAYAALLDQLRPDNLLVVLAAKGVPTDKTEPYYGTRYSYTEDTGAPYTALLHPPDVAAIQLPKPNPFVPAKPAVLPAEPVRLVDDPVLSLYYSQDTEFLRPMVTEIYRFRLPRSLATLETSVLLRFYENCLKESLNEVSYTAGEAGLNFNLNAALEGVQLTVSGYDESASRLLETVTGSLVDFPLSEERFAAIKDRLVRELANFPRADAWQILRETRRANVREFYYRPDEQLPVAQGVTLAAVKDFARRLYAQGKIEALVHGNVAADRAVADARRVAGALHPAAVPDADLLRLRVLAMKPGESLRTNEKLAVNNSAFRREYLLGGDDPETRAATLVLSNFISEPFYSELRTRQQLGYIVSAGGGDEVKTNYAYFIVQSGDHPADEVEARADAFIFQLPELLGNLPDEAWNTIVAGVRAQLEEKDKAIADRSGRLFELAYDRSGEWTRREETLAALDKLTKARAREIFAAALNPDTREMRTFLGFARQHEAKTPPATTYPDRDAWKKQQGFK